MLANGFDKIQRGGHTLYIRKNFRNNTLEQALLAGEKELQRCYQLTTIQSSKFARVYKFTVHFDDADREIYYKSYLYRSIWDFIKHLFRTSRASRAFNASLMLAENGFDTPAIIAMGKRKFNLFYTEDFLVTLGVENAKRIYECLFDTLENLTSEQVRSKRKLAQAFGRTVGRMHARGIFHGDLRLGNILAKQENDNWRFFLLDNERTKKIHRLPFRLRLKNLVQVNMFPPAYMSNSDRMRFFKEYWAESKKSGVKKVLLIKKILKKTSRRLRKKMRSGG
ncbi:MAG: hypothetical protein DRP62_05260 [Planctomycetota bacterium]|nr:MAG: hypothetical protein DRP62_05260 [Planctomycetota bacterium]